MVAGHPFRCIGVNLGNLKMRTNIAIDLSCTEQEVSDIVMANAVVQKWMEGKPVKKLIFVKGKMINVVIDYYVFTGGAHGYSAVRSLAFNPKTGKILPLNEIFEIR